MANNGFKKPYNPATGAMWGSEKQYQHSSGVLSDRYQYNQFRPRTSDSDKFNRKSTERHQRWAERRTKSALKRSKAQEDALRGRNDVVDHPQGRISMRRMVYRGGSSIEEKLRLREELYRKLRDLKSIQYQQHSHHHEVKKLRIAQQNLPYNYNVATVGKVHKIVSEVSYAIKQLDRELMEMGHRDPSMETGSMYSRSSIGTFSTGDIDWNNLYSACKERPLHHKCTWKPAATMARGKGHVYKEKKYLSYPAN